MILTQSYIFIGESMYVVPKKYDKGKFVFKAEPSILDLLSEKLCKFKKNKKNFDKDNLKCEESGSGVLTISNTDISVKIKQNRVDHSDYIDISAEDSDSDKCIKALEKTHCFIKELTTDKVIIITFDSISKYYTDKIYPHLNTFERKLRQLMFNIYILHFGKEYFYKTTETDFNNDVFKRIAINSKGNKDTKFNKRLKNYFYELEYGQIIKLLFEPRWTKYDEEVKNNIIDSNDIGPKSDWDRFFSDKTKNKNIHEDIKELQKLRNKVAHCKLFYSDDYDRALNLVEKLNKDITSAIILTENKDYQKKNTERFFSALTETINKFIGFSRITHDYNILYNDELEEE